MRLSTAGVVFLVLVGRELRMSCGHTGWDVHRSRFGVSRDCRCRYSSSYCFRFSKAEAKPSACRQVAKPKLPWLAGHGAAGSPVWNTRLTIRDEFVAARTSTRTAMLLL